MRKTSQKTRIKSSPQNASKMPKTLKKLRKKQKLSGAKKRFI